MSSRGPIAASHPQIAWAKLRAMVEGAALASKALGFSAS
jgi:hypothetical protein